MVGVSSGDTHWAVEIAERMLHRVRLRLLDPPFHLADGVEVLRYFGAVARAEIALQTSEIRIEGVQQTGLFAKSSAALSTGAAFAKQAFKHNPRMRLRRQRRRGRGPRQVVLIDAA